MLWELVEVFSSGQSVALNVSYMPDTDLWSLHYGKISVTRRTFIPGAKISRFGDILGLFDQFERVLEVTYITHFPFR